MYCIWCGTFCTMLPVVSTTIEYECPACKTRFGKKINVDMKSVLDPNSRLRYQMTIEVVGEANGK